MTVQQIITKKKHGIALAALMLSASIFSQQANAADFKITASSSHPPAVAWVAAIKNHVVPEATKRAKALGHNIEWTEAYAGALYNFKNTLEGIQDGLGDVGWVGTLWEPNKLPLHNVTYYLPFVSDNVQAASEIEDELHNSVPQMKEMLLKFNQVYLGPQALDDYVVISTTPIKTVADLKGKKFYAPGASAQWLKGTGAVAVNGGLPIYYNGIKTGVADGAVVPGTGIFPFKLHEVAPYVTKVGLGGGFTGVLTMNKDKYDSLPPELQKMFQDLGKEYGDLVAKGVSGFHKKSMEVLLPKNGATVTTLPIEEQKKWAALLPDIAGEWAAQMDKRGLPGKVVIKAYMDGVRKRGETPLRNWDE